MRIGFDSSGSVLYELMLPESTTLLMASAMLMVPHEGYIQCEILDGAVVAGELRLLVSTQELERMVSVGSAGMTKMGDLHRELWVELTLRLDVTALGEYASAFAKVDEPTDLLFVTDGLFPVLLNLQHYRVQRIVQDTQAVANDVDIEHS